jgi:hypothetical protein
MAPAVMSWPADATPICSELEISFNVPGTSITPVPITKLPIKSAKSRAFSEAWDVEFLSAMPDHTLPLEF